MKCNKNENVCEMNFNGRFSKELPWRDVQQITSNEDHDRFRDLSSNSPQRVVQYFYRNSVVSFQEQKAFVVKTGYFYSHIVLGMCEGVGDDSRHGFGHIDIRVGS